MKDPHLKDIINEKDVISPLEQSNTDVLNYSLECSQLEEAVDQCVMKLKQLRIEPNTLRPSSLPAIPATLFSFTLTNNILFKPTHFSTSKPRENALESFQSKDSNFIKQSNANYRRQRSESPVSNYNFQEDTKRKRFRAHTIENDLLSSDSSMGYSNVPSRIKSFCDLVSSDVHALCTRERCITPLRHVNCGFSDIALTFSKDCLLKESMNVPKVILDRLSRSIGCREILSLVCPSQIDPLFYSHSQHDSYSLQQLKSTNELEFIQQLLPGRSIRGIVMSHVRSLQSILIRITAVEILPDDWDIETVLNHKKRLLYLNHEGLEKYEDFVKSSKDQSFIGNLKQFCPKRFSDHTIYLPDYYKLEREESLLVDPHACDSGYKRSNLNSMDTKKDFFVVEQKTSPHLLIPEDIPPCLCALLPLWDLDSLDLCLDPSEIDIVSSGVQQRSVSFPKLGTSIRAILSDQSAIRRIIPTLGYAWLQATHQQHQFPKIQTDVQPNRLSNCSHSGVMFDTHCGEMLLKKLGVGTIISLISNESKFNRASNEFSLSLGFISNCRDLGLSTCPYSIFSKNNFNIQSDVEQNVYLHHSLGITHSNLLQRICGDTKFSNPASSNSRYSQLGLSSLFQYNPFPPTFISLLPITPIPSPLNHHHRLESLDSKVLFKQIIPIDIMIQQFLNVLDKKKKLVNETQLNERKPVFEFLYAKQSEGWAEELVMLGVMLARQGQFHQAIEQCNAALFHYTRCTDAFVTRGAAKANLKLYHEAIEDFNSALDIKPDDLNALRYKIKTESQLRISSRHPGKRLKDIISKPLTLPTAQPQITDNVFCLDWADERERLSRYSQ